MVQQYILDTPIEYLKTVGPQRADVLKSEFNIFTFGDLLNYFPFRYVDKTIFHKIRSINQETGFVQIAGKIGTVKILGAGRKQRLAATFFDDTGEIELVWFKGIRWIKNLVLPGSEFVIFGKPVLFNKSYNIPHPELEAVKEHNAESQLKLQPVYSATEKSSSKGLNSKGIMKIITVLLNELNGKIEEVLPQEVIAKYKLELREGAYFNIHFPPDETSMKKAIGRLKFEELFFSQLQIFNIRLERERNNRGHVFSIVGQAFNTFYKENLPFQLTEAQKKVMREIRSDMGSGKQMNRLLQGDVGSGKTIVALMSMLLAVDNNTQACLMAPTEILAIQHYNSISTFLKNLNVGIKLLTGSTKAAERREILEGIKSGNIKLLIGTHALLEDSVEFNNLGLAVIDEQHRFGVAQRARLWVKNRIPPHVLIMTATPIPRTLAMTFYGDLDTSVINELPPGRKPIKTIHWYDSSRLRLFGFMKEEIKKGRQIYVVYPLIDESEKLDYKDLTDGVESITRAFPLPEFKVGVVHGRMKPDERDFDMNRFKKGEINILVSTTVIEVGVDVPNASVMVIESAEKFGLSQLHQLRGRVGRGGEQSYCILMTKNDISQEALSRINVMVATNDGFKISEADLKFRGPGDITGTKQSGDVPLRLSNLAEDGPILTVARDAAKKVLESDPNLNKPENKNTRIHFNRLMQSGAKWGSIS
jgi:ATP-dependent DNA helicase RecG